MSDPAPRDHRAGFIALVGRPNVGKSTLLNQVVGTTLAAVANKPQTTRNRIVGILNRPRAQLVFVDTPGIHHAKTPMNARLVTTARQALGDADVVVLVLDASAGITGADRHVAGDVQGRPHTVIALTKIDLVSKSALLPACTDAQALLSNAELVPVSGKTGDNVERLCEVLTAKLPVGPPLYPPDQVTEQSERFLAAEIVREKVIAQTRDEVPYTTAVVVEAFREEPGRNLVVVTASIIVERDSQKGIIIGERGQRVRDIGRAARLSLEQCFGCRIYLELHVKVVPEWSKNPRMLGELGI
ncbi:MAG: GTPase Era [Deltaproteobacteria bacterium]|nr:GTPase Era [Deltaproteobacteria bacterium]